jgi:hypothetical protein
MPSRATIFRWIARYKEFHVQGALRARADSQKIRELLDRPGDLRVTNAAQPSQHGARTCRIPRPG